MELIEKLLDFVKVYGFKSLIGVAILAFIGYGLKVLLPPALEYWKQRINTSTEGARVEARTQEQLFRHPYFTDLKNKLNYDIPHFEINDDPLRSAISKNFLLIKFSCIHRHCLEFITSGHINKISTRDFQQKLEQLVYDIVKDYEERARKDEIPECFIREFNIWHKSTILVICNFIEDICDVSAGNMFVDNVVKYYVFLNQLNSATDKTLIDAAKALRDLNGELDAVVYKGIVSNKKKKKREE